MKRILIISLIVIIGLTSFGCGKGNKKDETLSQQDIYIIYNSLESRYIEIMDFYQALENKKVSKFNWRIVADSAKNSSERYKATLENSQDPMAPKLISIAENIIVLTEQIENYVDRDGEIDWSYQEKIESQLEEIRPEMEALREELLNK